MSGKLIVIEGVDGTGKTTLINGLKRVVWPNYIFNYSYPKEESFRENLAYMLGEYYASVRIFKELMANGETIICDRFHLGEFAYGPIKRGYLEELTWDRLLELEYYIKEQLGHKNIFMVVLLVKDHRVVIERISKKPEDEQKAEYLTRINDFIAVNSGYRESINRSILNRYRMFVDKLTPEVMLENAEKFINGVWIET